MKRYDLERVDLPKMSGTSLAMFARAIQTPIVGAAALDKLAADAGVGVLADARLDEPPRPLPLVPVQIADPQRKDPAVDLSPIAAVTRTDRFTARQIVESYERGETDPVKLTTEIFERIDRAQLGTVFIKKQLDHALRQAKASKARWDEGKPLGPLDGVPVAVKDEMDLKPYPTTVGTKFLGREAAADDATIVKRLRDAGAVFLGKANMHEIGINPNCANPHYGLVRNPYDPSRDTGGSSSGSAAAVAARFCPLALGADGGGSIRIPAALTGTVGLKATYGRISEHGVAPLCWTVGHVGPIGTSVADVALGYALIAGPDPLDANSLVQPPVALDGLGEDLTGLRIGIFRPWFEHAEASIVSCCDAAVEHLVAAGAKRVDVDVPHLDLIRVAHAITILSEMATSMDDHAEHHGELAPHVRVNLAVARRFTSADYVRAQRVRNRAMAALDEVFEEIDLLVTPSTAITAPPIPVTDPKMAWSDLSTVTELMRYAFLQNLTGHPAISVPAGYDGAGLPIGLQLTGRHWEEALLLRAALVVEAATAYRPAPESAA
ncbi:MAG: amidase [Deltaproteobacteria bacterium]